MKVIIIENDDFLRINNKSVCKTKIRTGEGVKTVISLNKTTSAILKLDLSKNSFENSSNIFKLVPRKAQPNEVNEEELVTEERWEEIQNDGKY